jgi:tetratricopeptide (TPR) repeat protein
MAAVLAMCCLTACGSQRTDRIDMHKRLAGELQSNRLHRAAIEEYQQALALDGLSDGQRANLHYLIGRIYYEDIRDYERAASHYVRAKEYDPNGSFMTDASRNLVASLEKLGNVIDAKRQLDAATDSHQPASANDVAVATIGQRSVWRSEIEAQLAALPPETQKRFLNREARLEFIRQYVGVELLYEAAMREDYLSLPEIQRRQEELTRQLLVNRYVVDKVMPQVRMDTLDIRNFYEVHKDKTYRGAPYDSVKAQVFLDYQSQKAESAYSEYINRLAKAQRVEFLDYNVK